MQTESCGVGAFFCVRKAPGVPEPYFVSQFFMQRFPAGDGCGEA
ncbi:hypothetical protein CLOSYM_00556 [[Clostridium] symbiosum ATCC 14940]|uniref:Glutamine amidotransferase type-2 domain-containing protein n=1 Tax=[Clostridium] symbiosum ATCC 14940 TaxID=411472 RepID=A0ABC9U2U0_CLOSY|nr:hypothetical protein CLOSYM_00556 [[Clostridium] symbiosum ATCC 14940]